MTPARRRAEEEWKNRPVTWEDLERLHARTRRWNRLHVLLFVIGGVLLAAGLSTHEGVLSLAGILLGLAGWWGPTLHRGRRPAYEPFTVVRPSAQQQPQPSAPLRAPVPPAPRPIRPNLAKQQKRLAKQLRRNPYLPTLTTPKPPKSKRTRTPKPPKVTLPPTPSPFATQPRTKPKREKQEKQQPAAATTQRGLPRRTRIVVVEVHGGQLVAAIAQRKETVFGATLDLEAATLASILPVLTEAPGLVAVELPLTSSTPTARLTYSTAPQEAVVHLSHLRGRVPGLVPVGKTTLEDFVQLDQAAPRLIDGAWVTGDTPYAPLVARAHPGEGLRGVTQAAATLLQQGLPVALSFAARPCPMWEVGTAISVPPTTEEDTPDALEASSLLSARTQTLREQLCSLDLVVPARARGKRIVQLLARGAA